MEESYDNSDGPITGRLLPGDSNINVGSSNSARGEGTTTQELAAKLRFLNCGACLFILLFYSLPIFLNPIRLTLLVASPVKLILELIVGVLALFILLVEARIPILGEQVLILMRGVAFGRFQCLDLDVARGRVLALVIVGSSMTMINYLSHNGVPPSKSSGDEPTSDELYIPSANITDFGTDDTSASDVSASSLFMIIIQCTIFSPSILIVLTLTAYTLYVVHIFPEYSEARAYSIQDGSSTSTTPATASSGPSWASHVGEGNGYQTVDA